jgi:DNA-binding MarR family transcriptional regulator
MARANTRARSRETEAEPAIDADIRELTALMYAAMGRFQVIRRRLASLIGLTPAQFAVIMSLHRLGTRNGASIRELADSIHVAAANVTVTVKALEKAGWVLKRPDPDDNRAVLVELTKFARARLDRFFVTIHPVNDVWFRDISTADQSRVKRFLLTLINRYPFALQQARALKGGRGNGRA